MSFAKFIRGAVKYNSLRTAGEVQRLQQATNTPDIKAVTFTCADSRVLPTRFLQSDIGDMFLVRNAGNFIPHAKGCRPDTASNELGVLELACVHNNVKRIAVCGHSDCRAMNTLHGMITNQTVRHKQESPLKRWLATNGTAAMDNFLQMKEANFSTLLRLELEHPKSTIYAHIDPELKLTETDRLAQINTLQQLQNISSHQWLHEVLDSGEVKMAALWFDVRTGTVSLFSAINQRFVEITEQSAEDLIIELCGPAS